MRERSRSQTEKIVPLRKNLSFSAAKPRFSFASLSLRDVCGECGFIYDATEKTENLNAKTQRRREYQRVCEKMKGLPHRFRDDQRPS
jgi:hypothetical protein